MADNTRTSRLRLRPSEHRILLLIGDLITAYLAVFGALYTWVQYSWFVLLARGISPERAEALMPRIQVPIWFFLMPFLWVMLLVNLYEPHSASSWRKTLGGVAAAAFVGLIAYSLVFITLKDPNALPRIGVGAFLVIASVLTLMWRSMYIQLNTSPGLMRRVLIIGAGKAGQTLVKAYKSILPSPFNLIGFIDDDPRKIGTLVEGYRVHDSSERLLDIVEKRQVTDLVVAISGEMRGTTFQTLLDAQERGLDVMRMPSMYEELLGRVPVHHLESDWVIRSFVDDLRVSGFFEVGKRLLDLIGGTVGMLIFLALFPFAALVTIIDSGFPIFYTQARLGRGGKEFTIYKFRTMHQDAESDGKPRLAEENDPRVTRVGNFMRKTRIDEFPQFINVMRGEMSLVGPRAERPELVAHFQRRIPFYRARLLVKPGVTGWAQVNFGYVSTVEDTAVKLEYDLYYIKHRNFFMDIMIILMTVGTMFGFRGR
jgi:exopolysaccharide biosynthesis polyprenyl glycosylphosphotransferase